MLVAIRRSDGGVSIMTIVAKHDPTLEIAKWQDTSPIKATGWHVINADDLPKDRTFRNAWKSDGKRIVVDIPAARTIKLASIRSERNRRLQATDGEMMRLQEQGTKAQVTALKATRQALRDIPQAIAQQLDAITDTDTLRDFQPQWPA